jgi:hypothetical protein
MTTIQSLKAFLTAPVSECNFSQLNTLIHAKNIHLGITFWGERVIAVQEEEGSVSLHALAYKVVSVIEVRCPSSKDWSSDKTPDKVDATSVVDHLYKCYSETDTLIANVNLFTWILSKIRDHGFYAAIARSDIEYLYSWSFKVGYKIQRAPFWGYDDIPAWSRDQSR